MLKKMLAASMPMWTVAIAFAVGITLGTMTMEPVAVSQPTPEVIRPTPEVRVVEATPVIRTEVQTVEVERAPKACLDLIDDTVALTGFMIDQNEITIAMLDAVGAFDLSGMERANAQLDRLVPRLGAILDEAEAHAAACRAAG